jgi:hypothetical protein
LTLQDEVLLYWNVVSVLTVKSSAMLNLVRVRTGESRRAEERRGESRRGEERRGEEVSFTKKNVILRRVRKIAKTDY